MCLNQLYPETKFILETYVSDSIQNIFVTAKDSENFEIIKIYDNLNKIIQHKFEDSTLYHESLDEGMKAYMNDISQMQSNIFISMLSNATTKNDKKAKQGIVPYSCYKAHLFDNHDH